MSMPSQVKKKRSLRRNPPSRYQAAKRESSAPKASLKRSTLKVITFILRIKDSPKQKSQLLEPSPTPMTKTKQSGSKKKTALFLNTIQTRIFLISSFRASQLRKKSYKTPLIPPKGD